MPQNDRLYAQEKKILRELVNKGIKMRRTEPIIRFDILQALAFQGPLKVTHLACKANIGFKKLVNFLDNLVAEGLVNEREMENKHIVYLITTKGLRAFKDSPRITL